MSRNRIRTFAERRRIPVAVVRVMSFDLGSLRLRPIALTDAACVHEWASLEKACRYQHWGPNTHDETHAFVEAAVAAWSAQPCTRRVWVAEDSRQLVAGIGEVGVRVAGRAEISYAVHVDLWGLGVGTTIGRPLVAWAFENLDVERVEATCDPRNVGSERILRRLGMTHEGTLRHVLRIRDGWRDSHV